VKVMSTPEPMAGSLVTRTVVYLRCTWGGEHSKHTVGAVLPSRIPGMRDETQVGWGLNWQHATQLGGQQAQLQLQQNLVRLWAVQD
jgi:hypothetical protein